ALIYQFFFFFQAEDGIRDYKVTGVQTCALPILEVAGAGYINARVNRAELAESLASDVKPRAEAPAGKILVEHSSINPNKAAHVRSEERRVGKESRCRWGADHKQRKTGSGRSNVV